MSKLMAFSPPTGKGMTEREFMTNPTFLVCAAICVSAFLIVIIMILGALKAHKRKTQYCDVEDCRIHALILKGALNTSVNPCANFYDFTCGSWRGSRAIPTRNSLEEVTLKVYTTILQTFFQQGGKTNLPRKLFQTCNAPTSSDKDVGIFKQLKQKMGMLWPEKPPTDMHPLDLLFRLSTEWNFNFLVTLRVIPASKRRNRTLVFSQGTIAASFQKPLGDSASIIAFQRHVLKHYNILGASTEPNFQELQSTERAILAVAVDVRHGVPEQVTVPVASMPSFTPNVDSQRWLQLLNRYYSQQETPFQLEQIAILEDARLLRNIGKLLKNYSENQLVIGITWIFIQSYLWAVSGTPEIRFGTTESVNRYKAIACLELVNSALGLMGATDYLHSKVSKRTQYLIVDLTRNLTRSAEARILASQWIDTKTKLAAVGKLQDVQLDVWSVGDWPDLNGLGNMTDSFISNLATISVNARMEPFKAVRSKQIAPPSGFLSYFYYLNQISAAPGGANAPLLYPNGTIAMKYGGMGILIARKLVKAFDLEGVTFDHRGNAVDWVNASSSPEYKARASCDTGGVPVFPTVPALAISLGAFKQAIEDDNIPLADFRLRGLKDYTEDQVFFITFCHSFCSMSRKESEDECNVPLRHFPSFAKTFKCPADAPMNPSRKCTFF